MIAPATFDRVQYTLSYGGTESITIREIENWGDDEKEYGRNTDYDGIFIKHSNNLVFVEDGRDFIQFIRDTYGIQAEVYLRKEERHPQTDVWVQTYAGYLDLSTWGTKGGKLTVKLNSGGAEQLLKVRESEQVEIDRETDLDGKELPPLSTIDVVLNGRKIFLMSSLENDTPAPFTVSALTPYISPILKKVISSDTRVVSTLAHVDGTYFVGYNTGDQTRTFPQIQQFFYIENDRFKVLRLKFNLEVDVQFNWTSPSKQFIELYIQKSKIVEGEADPQPVTLYNIGTLWGSGSSQIQKLTYTAPISLGFPLQKDECLALVWGIPQSPNNIRNRFDIKRNDIIIEEDSFFEATKCKMVLAQEMAKRLIKIITGKDLFYSVDIYKEFSGFAHGFWLREFFRDDQDESNKFKPLTTSWLDFMEAMRVTRDMGVGIDVKGKRERIRMEKKAFFYQNTITIRLPNVVQEIERSTATEYYYSGVEVGYEKGGEYEESMGLDEYNGKATFATYITRLKNIFKIVSPYRTDSYGAEFARRKTRKYYPNEDTRYDQDVFQFDLTRTPQFRFALRRWQDDFEQMPENVYSPETAYNLRYSPVNTLLRHGWEIASGLIKYPLEFIRYTSSNVNSRLITKLIGREAFQENEDIRNDRLKKPKFVPEWVDFFHECSFEVMQQVEGFTDINGEEIPNFYGLVEYKTDAFGSYERGFLFNLKPNGRGAWRVLKANK